MGAYKLVKKILGDVFCEQTESDGAITKFWVDRWKMLEIRFDGFYYSILDRNDVVLSENVNLMTLENILKSWEADVTDIPFETVRKMILGGNGLRLFYIPSLDGVESADQPIPCRYKIANHDVMEGNQITSMESTTRLKDIFEWFTREIMAAEIRSIDDVTERSECIVSTDDFSMRFSYGGPSLLVRMQMRASHFDFPVDNGLFWCVEIDVHRLRDSVDGFMRAIKFSYVDVGDNTSAMMEIMKRNFKRDAHFEKGAADMVTVTLM